MAQTPKDFFGRDLQHGVFVAGEPDGFGEQYVFTDPNKLGRYVASKVEFERVIAMGVNLADVPVRRLSDSCWELGDFGIVFLDDGLGESDRWTVKVLNEWATYWNEDHDFVDALMHEQLIHTRH